MVTWKADRRLFLSADDQVVEETYAGRKTLLAAAGRDVPDEVCQKYGLGLYAIVGEEVVVTTDEDPPPRRGRRQGA